jgi:hypothetical protein
MNYEEIKIKESIIKGFLDSIAEKQEDNVRFIPVVIKAKIMKKNVIKLIITSENDVIEPIVLELLPGDSMTMPGCYYRLEFDS